MNNGLVSNDCEKTDKEAQQEHQAYKSMHVLSILIGNIHSVESSITFSETAFVDLLGVITEIQSF